MADDTTTDDAGQEDDAADASDASTPDDDSAGDTGSADSGDDSSEGGAEDEQQAGETEEAQGQSDEGADADIPELEGITDEALKDAYRKLPPEIRKANQKVFSKHTAKLASLTRRSAAEKSILDALARDPKEAVAQLARHAGLKVSDESAAPTMTAQVKAQFETLLGKDNAEKFLPVLELFVDARTADLKAQLDNSVRTAAQREVDAELSAFQAANWLHPAYGSTDCITDRKGN